MATIIKKNIKQLDEENPYFKAKYTTIQEASEAKTDYLMNVILKDFDFKKLRK